MRHTNLSRSGRRGRVAGFSLVELLTVVAIIVLLIGILVPAVNKVRTTARATATDAMIGTLSTGLETFRADQQVGGSYPPSASDMDTGSVDGAADPYQVASPYSLLENGAQAPFDISGAGLLVWALAGADQLGIPGFRVFRQGSNYWSEDTGDDDTDDDPSAYALNSNTWQPLRQRVDPFVDISKVEMTSWNPLAVTEEGSGSFEVAAEADACEAMGITPARRNYPLFLDPFGGPILYYRADKAGVRLLDRPPSQGTTPANRGRYHYLDNGALLMRGGLGSGPGTNQDPVILRPYTGDDLHRLPFVATPPGQQVQEQRGFALYIQDTDIQAAPTPHNRDSYLLMSAGPDGIFGSGDDIANFPHNGAELSDRR